MWSGGEKFPVLISCTFMGLWPRWKPARVPFPPRTRYAAHGRTICIHVQFTCYVVSALIYRGVCQPSMRLGVPAASINGPRDEHQQASLRRGRPHPAKHQVTRYTAKYFATPCRRINIATACRGIYFHAACYETDFATRCCGIGCDAP